MLERICKPNRFVRRWMLTRGGQTAAISNDWTWSDYCGAVGIRIGIDRNNYRVPPGLYAAGNPGPDAPVLVTANYKLTFDIVRRDIRGLDAWILVLDTKGVNVWCAAGKGTFSTGELLKRIEAVSLSQIVSHRQLIVPQLGATGVSAHAVKDASGFQVLFGPVRSKDIRTFLQAGMRATPHMRRVGFPLRDRLAVSLVECSRSIRPLVIAMAALFVIAGLGTDIFSWERAWHGARFGFVIFLLGFVAGNFLTPLLLPWLPGRAFSQKGAEAGGILGLALLAALDAGLVLGIGVLLGVTAIASWYGMHFTGASTYTSPTGVEKEMRLAIPWQTAAALFSAVLWRVGIC
jgi:hypothetical protein